MPFDQLERAVVDRVASGWVNAVGERRGRMATTVEHQTPVAVRVSLWAVLADPGVRIAIAAGGLVLGIGGGLLVGTSDHLVDGVAYGLQLAIMVIGTVWAALVWLKRRPGNRVGVLLLALALATSAMTLQGARNEVLHSLGVLVEPAFFLLAYAAIFAVPEGRLGGWTERLILAGMALYFAVAFLPWLFFSPVTPGGAPLAGCNESCPANGLMIADRPKLAASFGSDMAWAVIVVLTATLACLVFRLVVATRPRLRMLLPVYVPALMLTIPLLGFHGFAAGVLHLDADTLSTAGWFVTTSRCLTAFGFLLAIAQASYFAGSALKRLLSEIGGNPSALRLREIVADALDDPSVELAFRVDGRDHFVNSQGEPVAGVAAPDGRATSAVGRQGDTVAAIWHDPVLNTDPELLQAASQAMLLALENGRLESELAAARMRAVAAGDEARRKVERDLHDGAQQQLVGLQIKIALARELVGDDPEVSARLADVGQRIDAILDELRDLAHGVRPPLLRHGGLRAALGAAAHRSTLPVELEAAGLARYPEAVESAVYFCCLEALQNVGKHAGADAHAAIRVSERADALCFEIVDDGVGCEITPGRGSGGGLTNMSERVAAVHGTLTVDSGGGRGTRVSGRIPLTVN